MTLLLLGGTTTIKDCGDGRDIAKYISGSINPIPAVPGENMTVSFTYNIGVPITDGTVDYSYTINYLPAPSVSKPLCEETSCPKEVGTNTETSTSVFPTDVSGRIEGKISWKNEFNEQILCVQTIFFV